MIAVIDGRHDNHNHQSITESADDAAGVVRKSRVNQQTGKLTWTYSKQQRP